MQTPPPHLMIRVSGNDAPETFLRVGRESAEILMNRARAYCRHEVADVLDWGCGPGRVASQIAVLYPDVRLRGCDPDGEAIAWCRETIPGEFTTSDLYPPLPYEDGSCDAVCGLSVMTHLRRRVQRVWLKEPARVLRSGGLLLATVHGRAAAARFEVFELRGIEDHYLDPYMAGVLPAEYYRTVL